MKAQASFPVPSEFRVTLQPGMTSHESVLSKNGIVAGAFIQKVAEEVLYPSPSRM